MNTYSDYLVVNALLNRLVEYWIKDEDEVVLNLYRQMYERYAEDGILDNVKDMHDVMDVVDNDWVNYCHIYDAEEMKDEGIDPIEGNDYMYVEETFEDENGDTYYLVRY